MNKECHYQAEDGKYCTNPCKYQPTCDYAGNIELCKYRPSRHFWYDNETRDLHFGSINGMGITFLNYTVDADDVMFAVICYLMEHEAKAECMVDGKMYALKVMPDE